MLLGDSDGNKHYLLLVLRGVPSKIASVQDENNRLRRDFVDDYELKCSGFKASMWCKFTRIAQIGDPGATSVDDFGLKCSGFRASTTCRITLIARRRGSER